MNKYSLGLDFGTESARAVLVDVGTGEIVATAIHPYGDGVIDEALPGSDVALAPDWALQNPDDWLAALEATIPPVLAESSIRPEAIIGLGVDFTACTVLPTTANGTPLCTLDAYREQPHAWAKLWKHHAAQPQADQVNELALARDESWLPRYGSKISSEWLMPKALQMLEEAPDLYAAADHIVEGAERYALHVKGLEMVCFEPRTQTNLALGYATAPIGPRYDICEHDWDYDTQVGWEHTLNSSRTVGILERISMDYLGEEKVRNFKALAALWSSADALDFCIFAIAPTRVLTLHDMAELLSAVTGWNTSAYEIMRFGERRLHLMRVYNLREGLTAADDTLPCRFFDESLRMPGKRWDGTRLERERFAAAVQTYYRMMGWDDAGRPRYETLLDHHLEWVVEEGHALRQG